MDKFTGTIIEESLENASVFKSVKITSTKVEPITEKHRTPWVKQWVLHKVEIEASEAKEIAERISEVIDNKHKSSWYADFKNDYIHYIIFRNKVFEINRTNKNQYEEAEAYGLKLGIPDYQMKFAERHSVQ